MSFTLAIVLGTVICGCLNSLLTKYQDNQCVGHCNNPDVSKHRLYGQPGIQTLQMFIGEAAIYIVYYCLYKAPWTKRSQYTQIQAQEPSLSQSMVLAIPSVCDMLATSLMNIGLVYTPVSIYQMTRGAVVLFVAVMSVVFLKRRIRKLEWIALFVVTLGIAVVGYSGSSGGSATKEDPRLIVLGMSFIIVAVSLQAVQFVVEEKILSHYSFTPLKLVYTEGVSGCIILVLSLVLLHFAARAFQTPSEFAHSKLNLQVALTETFSSSAILGTSLLVMVCISAFNFCGISLTHHLSATSRSTIDSCRTLLVWLVAMCLGWESFRVLQFLGFCILVFGTLCFNGVLQPEEWEWVPSVLKDKDHSNERLIDVVDEPIERM
ncbi:hypothetical protein JCM33374_g26 [Metschnikowia sp. JCM 33374]|nr:hypothetical protein JCM33374_g26 [Metschnikowia sp. JCM 33374]